MTRFSSPKAVKDAAESMAIDLHRRHVEQGNDLNPYTTDGARSEFQRAYDNGPFYSFERQDQASRDFDYRYQLGQAVARLVKLHEQEIKQ